ncbi:MAG: hypothetical protein RR600_06940, partial [Aurantimicrobium sp.]|uniref:hypothetical protein n=1 Tax=Aurantimicrobium sp. TaxID=1930784 RepID=UPI0032201137
MKSLAQQLSESANAKVEKVVTVYRDPIRYKRSLPSLHSGSGIPAADGFVGGGCFAVAGEVEHVAVSHFSDKPKGLFELQIENYDGTGETLAIPLEQTGYNRACRVVFKAGATFRIYFTSTEQ